MDELATLAIDLRRVRQHHRCGVCAGSGLDAAQPHGRCVEPGVYRGREWSTCPYGAMASPLWRAIVEVDALAMVSPLEAWPLGWSAALAEGMLALRRARQAAEARAMREAAARSR